MAHDGAAESEESGVLSEPGARREADTSSDVEPADGIASPPAGWIRVCASDELEEGGDGVRFELPPARAGGQPVAAFVVRYDGRPRAWLNICRHVPIELDWMPGKFFDVSGLYVVCATHGATYEPDTGHCIAGPCKGASLEAVAVIECDAAVWANPARSSQ